MALGSRPARSTRRRGRPWLVVAVLLSVLVLVVNAAMSARSPAPARAAAEQSYLDQALIAIQQSSQEGLDIAAVRNQTIGLLPSTMISHVNGVLTQAQAQLAAVEKLNPPAAVKTAHALLVAALDLRVVGIKAFGQAIGTAVSGQPVASGIQALTDVGVDFQAGDRTYRLFQQAMPPVTPPVPSSVWVPDGTLYNPTTLSVFVATLRSAGSLSPIHDVTVLVVTTNPLPVNTQNGVEMLPVAKQLSMQVVVADIGNQPEKNLTVTATIAPALFGPTQSIRNFVTDLAPGQTVTVSLGGLRVASAQPTTLTVQITSPAGETNTADDTKVIMLQMQ